MKKIIYISGLLIVSIFCKAQNLDIPSVFKPGIRLGGLYMPDINVNDSVKYGIGRIRMTLIIPLNGNVKLDLKHLNIAASQSFLSLNAGVRETHFSPVNSSNQVYNAALGFTHIRASLKNGFWVYHGRLLYDYDMRNHGNDVFSVLGGAVKIYVKSLTKINIFGLGVAYSKRLIPFPIIGFRRKIAENISLTAILPLEVDLNFKVSQKFEMEFKNSLSAIKTGFLVDTTNTHLVSYRDNNVILSNYSYLVTLLFIYKPSNNFQIYAEGGVYPFLQLNLTKQDDKTKISRYKHYFAPYASITLRYSMGKFRFGSQLFGTDE